MDYELSKCGSCNGFGRRKHYKKRFGKPLFTGSSSFPMRRPMRSFRPPMSPMSPMRSPVRPFRPMSPRPFKPMRSPTMRNRSFRPMRPMSMFGRRRRHMPFRRRFGSGTSSVLKYMGNTDPNQMSYSQSYTGMGPSQMQDHVDSIPPSLRSNFYGDV
jgi:hypothetical protein